LNGNGYKTKGVLLSGTNQTSVSTEEMGWVTKKQILGKVFYHFSAYE